MNQIAFEIGWHADQAGGLWNVDVDNLNRHLRRSLHTKDGGYRIPLELVHERLQGGRNDLRPTSVHHPSFRHPHVREPA